MAEDGVGRGDVEIEIGDHEGEEIGLAEEGQVPAAHFERDLALLAAVDLRWFEGLQEGGGLGDARLQLGEGRVDGHGWRS